MVEQWLLTLDLERAKTSFRRYEEDDKVKVAVAKRLKELGLTKEEAYMTHRTKLFVMLFFVVNAQNLNNLVRSAWAVLMMVRGNGN